ncbi:conserved hypothetical protein [Talaromyces stipitatus ATCC 10500]|uniref:xyloglucan-specific endo-beta-1,4-glucanase n=1 Tax=Talaromyces stipitatus (strain ATCC 10500 / CBS 375.48 / QM 6759 / NRRL 1006) TaxID=441959 RepID=B8MMD2_TALSN|nr:uncharacterized protein TSTA_099380 [Talaromyces stipitatus ATCC 10500]EED13686.1 conserved hypothetical protein [Talaromyces stipitatus ATCC 10500]
MAFRWIVNAGLIAIPIGSTLGVLFGIDASRHAAGQAPLFSPPDDGTGSGGSGSGSGSGGSGGSGGGNIPPDSTGGGHGGSHSNDTELGVTVSTYCSLTYGILPPAKGGLNYSLNPNQWGVLAQDGPDAPSGLCMNVTTFNNQTYPTKTSAPEWTVTWKYDMGPETQPVHAYPNIQVLDGLPVTLSDVKAVNFDMAWIYNLGNETKPTSDTPEFDSISLNTNVAIDMFFDGNETNASNSSLAAYEIMVWFAHYGNAAQAIGNSSGIVERKIINQTEFDLYHGSHIIDGKTQNVFTWVASENIESFYGDISPLITELTSKTGTEYPKESDYMGSFGFGTEAYSANQFVTFHVPRLEVNIQT